MQKPIFFLFLFLTFVGQASETPPSLPTEEKIISESYWKFHHSAYIGYRRDRQQFDTFGTGILNTRMQIQDRNSAQLFMVSHAEYKNLVGNLTGAYGWLLSGQTHLRDPGNIPPLAFPGFKLGAGYNVEARGTVFWRFTLYHKDPVQCSFLPGIGYRYAHLMNDPQGIQKYLLPASSNVAYCQYPKSNQQDWFGPYVEGRAEFLFWNFFELSFFCQYQKPFLVSRTKYLIEIYDYDGAQTLVSDQLSTIHSVIKSGQLQMVLGGLGTKFSFGPGWAVGTHFEGATTWKEAHDHVHLSQEQFLSTPPVVSKSHFKDKATVRWTYYTASVMVDRRF